jgi:hypothetical protein
MSVLELENNLIEVVNFRAVYAFHVGLDIFKLARYHVQYLVDKMHAPVIEHTAAALFIEMPIMHNAAGAVKG